MVNFGELCAVLGLAPGLAAGAAASLLPCAGVAFNVAAAAVQPASCKLLSRLAFLLVAGGAGPITRGVRGACPQGAPEACKARLAGGRAPRYARAITLHTPQREEKMRSLKDLALAGILQTPASCGCRAGACLQPIRNSVGR